MNTDRHPNLLHMFTATAVQEETEGEEGQGFHKLWPASKTDCLCQSWQSCQMGCQRADLLENAVVAGGTGSGDIVVGSHEP